MFLFSRAACTCVRFDDALLRSLLELLIVFAHLHQLGQHVVAMLEQHVNIGSGLIHRALHLNQVVVQADTVDQCHDADAKKDQGNAHVNFLKDG